MSGSPRWLNNPSFTDCNPWIDEPCGTKKVQVWGNVSWMTFHDLDPWSQLWYESTFSILSVQYSQTVELLTQSITTKLLGSHIPYCLASYLNKFWRNSVDFFLCDFFQGYSSSHGIHSFSPNIVFSVPEGLPDIKVRWTCAGIILWTLPANERRRYIVTSSLICWVHSQNDLCLCHNNNDFSRNLLYRPRSFTYNPIFCSSS